ncbi:MAG: T9SS type A sorting domain-containing protein [Bacteroidales bacterium]|nr:T9SS type A sorting domain-containing protein [Bacteroidales bacterium]
MKKTLLLTIALLLSTAMFAQSRAIILSESFNTSGMPSGWGVYGGGNNSWTVQNTNRAGGMPWEMEFFWEPQFEGTSYLSMGSFDLSNIPSFVISFKHYYENYSNESTIGIATSSDGGVTWNSGWSKTFSVTAQYVQNELITTSDIGKDNVMIALYFEGNSYDINYWSFDDFLIYSQEGNDINVESFDISANLGVGQSEVKFTAKNLGTNAIESFEASYQVEGGETVTQTFETNLASYESEQFTFDTKVTLFPGEYTINLNINKVNNGDDQDMNNNAATKDVIVGYGIAERIPMIEHFSSSTCYPCVFVNTAMEELTAANPGKYTYTKYPMNGPGTGDPYYTAECGTRRTYYNVNSVPTIFLDGGTSEAPVTQLALDRRLNEKSFVNIQGAFQVEGNTITLAADFMAYSDVFNAKAYVAVNEKTTTGNTGSNGETEFHHIMIKMLSSAQGQAMSINAGEIQHVEYTLDLSGTHVEDMNDLEVAMWLQNQSTKEIYNSKFAMEYTEHLYAVEDLSAVIGGDAVDFSIGWQKPEKGNPTGYNIYLDGELFLENYTDTYFSSYYENYHVELLEYLLDDNKHIVEVVAVYENGTSVGAAKLVTKATGTSEMAESNISIYPNPANDFVKISGNDNINSVMVYNCLGMIVEEIEVNANEVEISTSEYNTGIYFFDVMTENGNRIQKVLIR